MSCWCSRTPQCAGNQKLRRPPSPRNFQTILKPAARELGSSEILKGRRGSPSDDELSSLLVLQSWSPAAASTNWSWPSSAPHRNHCHAMSPKDSLQRYRPGASLRDRELDHITVQTPTLEPRWIELHADVCTATAKAKS